MSPGRKRQSPDTAAHRRYRDLATKYQKLVGRYEKLIEQRIASSDLALWAIRQNLSGHVLLDCTGVVSCNTRWNTLDRAAVGFGEWKLSRGPAALQGRELAWRTLREAVLNSVEHFRSSGEASWAVRYFVPPMGPYMDVRFERETGKNPSLDRVLVRATDVTELVSLERELDRARTAVLEREQLRPVAALSSAFAHDLTGLLSAMMFRLDALQPGPDQTVSFPDAIASLEEILSRAVGVVSRMHELSHTRRTANPALVPLDEVVGEVLALATQEIDIRRRTALHPVRIRAEIKGRPMVVGDRVALLQVLLALVFSARDAMRHGGEVVLRLAEGPSGPTLSVEDEGARFPGTEQGARAHPFAAAAAERSGAGLPLAAAFLERCGGSLSVRNRRGRGIRVTLEFPRLQPASGGGEQKGRAKRPRRVLLVDEDIQLQQSLSAAVPEIDFLHERSAQAAIDRLRKASVDAVLSQETLPDIDGWALARKLKRAKRAVPFFLISGWASALGAKDRRRKLVTAVLGTPVAKEPLLAALEAAAPVRRRR